MAFNKTALIKNPIFESERIANVDVIDKTIKEFCINTKDGKRFITVRTTDNKHFFASGVLEKLLLDNISNAFEDEFENYSFSDVTIDITFKGLKRSKSGRMYNDWEINKKE